MAPPPGEDRPWWAGPLRPKKGTKSFQPADYLPFQGWYAQNGTAVRRPGASYRLANEPFKPKGDKRAKNGRPRPAPLEGSKDLKLPLRLEDGPNVDYANSQARSTSYKAKSPRNWGKADHHPSMVASSPPGARLKCPPGILHEEPGTRGRNRISLAARVTKEIDQPGEFFSNIRRAGPPEVGGLRKLRGKPRAIHFPASNFIARERGGEDRAQSPCLLTVEPHQGLGKNQGGARRPGVLWECVPGSGP